MRRIVLGALISLAGLLPPAKPALAGWESAIGVRALDTMARMAKMVNADVTQPPVYEAATGIVRGIDGRDTAAQAAALMGWLRTHTWFVRDPQLLQSPLRMLAVIALDKDHTAPGDCDEVAMLAAALCKSINLPVLFIAEAYTGGPDAPLVHVYTVVQTTAGWRALDTQRPASSRPAAPVRRVYSEV